MDINELGVRLKELRAARAKKLGRRKIPQREVAEQLNVSPGAFGSWESGRTKPDVALLPRIADYFEVSIDYLLGYTANVQTNREPNATNTGLVWSLRRQPQTENEKRGVEIWCRIIEGESTAEIMAALKTPFRLEIERYLLDVIYTDMINIELLPLDADLAEQVRQRFDLRETIVIRVGSKSTSLFRYILLGEAARCYFKEHVYEGMKIGIAGGYSISRLIYSLRRGECQNIEIYPLAVSPVVEATDVDTNSLVGALAYWHYGYNVRGYSLQYASPLDRQETEDIQKFALTRRILAKAKSVDIAFLGLGTFRRRIVPNYWLGDLLESKGLSLDTMHQRGAVGDILYHFVNQNGQPVASEINNHICSIELKDLREMVRWRVPVVVIASGKRKVEIARATITGGYANVFIINNELAEAMLESEAE